MALCVGLVRPLVQAGVYGALGAAVLIVVTGAVCCLAVQHSLAAGWMFEHNVRRRFRAVCRERRLTTRDDRDNVVYPGLSRLIGNGAVLNARIRPLFGQSLADWERAAPAFALAYAVAAVRFRDNGDGSLTLLAGYQPLEAREFVMNEAEPVEGVDWRERLASVVVGTTEGGQPFALPFLDSHILIAGITGAGKGSVVWSAALALLPAAKAGVVRFWGIDPKRLELAMGRGFFGDRYANTDEQAVQLLERAAAEMLERAEGLAGHARRAEPSVLHPVNVLFIDELGYLSALMPDRKLRERAEKALSAILVLGRAAGFVVIGALQDPRKEVLNFRDLFPTAVAMRLRKPMVDLVLGAGMYEAGAVCDQIPPPKAGGAGVAFVVSEDSGIPVCVRFTWCPDDLIRKTAAELEPLAMRPQIAAN
ncbi:FtsK/SpoIIIE domain-containing protein [Pseudonocardia broussonetiae]|uniref:FtsK domain-containing protein n=1 Tax=Pseudonocardia broussonetiae TaxID=2736640 RepID=A0A6M6JVD8_9PSEU|nr:FtsK/SpoIIIE domain-containing protein [Pseudonocardia broussonetiae]QJY51213.1 hypothetical protein HOP40_35100 [Pseudonocardia broussonetiae]